MARHPFIDLERAMNTSTSTGTGNLTLDAAADGYVTLVGLAADSFPYCIEGIDGACAGQVARGTGQIVGGELVRGADEEYIDGEAWAAGPLPMAAGTKRIYLRVTPPADGNLNFIGALRFLSDTFGFNRCSASAYTTDATPTAMDGILVVNAGDEGVTGATFPLDAGYANKLLVFRLTVTASPGTTTDFKAWSLDFAVKYPSAGNAALLGSPSPVVLGESAGATTWGIGVTASGDLVAITVTGAATEISWALNGSVSLA